MLIYCVTNADDYASGERIPKAASAIRKKKKNKLIAIMGTK